MESSYKFLQRLWSLHQTILTKKYSQENLSKNDEETDIFTNQMIEKITNNLENFHYNVIVANLYEIYRYYKKKIQEPLNKDNFLNNYKNILKMMTPIIPHFANECLEQMQMKNNLDWPKINKDLLKIKSYNIVIQINGKKRDLLIINDQLNEKEILKKAKKSEKCSKYLEDKEIKKTIYVKNKLLNIIV